MIVLRAQFFFYGTFKLLKEARSLDPGDEPIGAHSAPYDNFAPFVVNRFLLGCDLEVRWE
jgi:hypothetical protein